MPSAASTTSRAPALEAADVKFDVSFLFGGQIKGEKLRLYMIYSAGNFIECTVDTPYLQIGEHKYGKPILDRAVRYGIDLYDALKIALISMDSTLRSNLGVGMPIDVAVVRRDACDAELIYRIEPGEPYFHDLQRALVGGVARRPYRHSASALRDAPSSVPSRRRHIGLYRRLTPRHEMRRLASCDRRPCARFASQSQLFRINSRDSLEEASRSAPCRRGNSAAVRAGPREKAKPTGWDRARLGVLVPLGVVVAVAIVCIVVAALTSAQRADEVAVAARAAALDPGDRQPRRMVAAPTQERRRVGRSRVSPGYNRIAGLVQPLLACWLATCFDHDLCLRRRFAPTTSSMRSSATERRSGAGSNRRASCRRCIVDYLRGRAPPFRTATRPLAGGRSFRQARPLHGRCPAAACSCS